MHSWLGTSPGIMNYLTVVYYVGITINGQGGPEGSYGHRGLHTRPWRTRKNHRIVGLHQRHQ